MQSDPYVSFLLYNVFAMYVQYGDSHSISIAYDCFLKFWLAQKPCPLHGYKHYSEGTSLLHFDVAQFVL